MILHGKDPAIWSREDCCNVSTYLTHANDTTIAVDFDGTCVVDHYPKVGPTNPGAEQVLAALQLGGAALCLWTCRRGKDLQRAVDWFWDKRLPLLGVNYNPNDSFYKKNFKETTLDTRANTKMFCDIYIDDRALGTPMYDAENGTKAVDWNILFFKYLLPKMRNAQ